MKTYMTRKKFLSILLRQRCSSLSVSDFCHNEGYNRSQFYEWRSRFKITDDELAKASEKMGILHDFTPIVIEPSPVPASIVVPTPQSLPQPESVSASDSKGTADNSEISLELPNGLKLKFKGETGCKTALDLISKIYNANVLPQ